MKQQESIIKQVNRVVLISVGLLILFCGVIMGELALFTEDRQSAVRLKVISDYHFKRFESEDIDVVEIDPLLTIFRDYSLLPLQVRNNLSPALKGSFSIHLPGKNIISESEVTVRAKKATNGSSETYYAVEKSEVVEWSSGSMSVIFLLYLIVGLILYASISFLLIKRLKILVNPFHVIAASIRSSTEHKKIPTEQNTSLEFDVLQNAISSYQQKIEELLERERAFSRNISHEIRSPLMVINGALSNIDEKNNEKLKKPLGQIEKASNDINELTKVFLSLVKKDTSKNKLVLVDDAYFAKFEPKHASRVLKKPFQIDCKSSFHINGNPTLINALLENLIKNGLRSNPLKSLFITITPYRIEIRDFGEGFQSGKIQGHGIGLPLVKDICDLYQIDFFLKNHNGEGCSAILEKPQTGLLRV